jgi:hypothetical protein
MVLSYKSLTLSKEQSRKWSRTKETKTFYSWTKDVFRRPMRSKSFLATCSLWLTSMLLTFGSQSLTVQEVIISMVNPLLVGSAAFLGMSLFNS